MKRLLLILSLCAVLYPCDGQTKRKTGRYNVTNRENPFLRQQWWIGLKGGVNASKISVEKSYGVIVPTNYPADVSKKNYKDWKPMGTQIGIEATYFFRGFSASIQPTYSSIRFSYDNQYSWTDSENVTNSLDLHYEQDQQASYVYVPLLIKYEFNVRGVTPYIQAGAFTAFLLDATKSVTVSGVDYASGGTNNFEYEPVSVGARDMFAKKHYGFIAGAGLYYNMGNIRLNLDVQYRMGRSLINSTGNRYGNDRLAGTGDAMDDMLVDTFCVSFGTLFPLRFLSSGFKSYDK